MNTASLLSQGELHIIVTTFYSVSLITIHVITGEVSLEM